MNKLCKTAVLRPVLAATVLTTMLLAGGCRNRENSLLSRLHPRKSKTRENSAEYADKVSRVLNTPHLDVLMWANITDYQQQVQQLYDSRSYQLAWTRDGRPTEQASALIQLFEHADQKGLRPEDYDSTRWQDLVQGLTKIQATHDSSEAAQNAIAQFDVAVTISAMRYVADLHLGRINPQALNFDIDVPSRRASFDLAGFLDDQVVDSGNVPDAISRIEPQNPMYQALEQALPRYLLLAQEQAGRPPDPLPPVAKPVSPGGSYPAVQPLLMRLQLEGDASGAEAPLGYDEVVADAVKRYQERHGLTPDGKLTQATINSMNVPMQARVQQIEDSLERWRWLPDEYVQPRLLVNLPEFLVRAYEPDHTPAFKMKVVDGEAKGFHDTPMFVRTMKYMIFRPYWNLPVSIVKKELVGHLHSGGEAYMAKNNYEVVNNKGQAVTGWTVADLDHSRYLVRQKPGPRNSLGLVKFMFPNIYDVYMHSTPEMHLFNLSRRDRSHGCVRLNDAEKMANWVLNGQGNWDSDKIHKAMFGPGDGSEAGNNKQVNLQRQLPVVITYLTANADEDGSVHFFDDIYGYDKQLEDALTRPRPYPQSHVAVNPKLVAGDTE